MKNIPENHPEAAGRKNVLFFTPFPDFSFADSEHHLPELPSLYFLIICAKELTPPVTE
jgi:hypothetical protein